MENTSTQIQRPQRWDEPFDLAMRDRDVDLLLKLEPFSQMDASLFSPAIPLKGLLKNDCRILKLKQGDIIVREGDYGSSAYLILEGTALVSLKSLPNNILGRQTSRKKGWFEAISQLWANSRHSEVRDYRSDPTAPTQNELGRREDELERVFLHDVPRVIGPNESVELYAGEFFGEISALTRSPRSATIVANSEMVVLEVRWQGFREFLKRDSILRKHIHDQYRTNSLRAHLREIEILKELPEIENLADVVEFESYGDFQWDREFRSMDKKDIAERILSEPVIAEAGHYPDGLVLIRNGFARLSRQHGQGHQTVAYLGKGEVFGLRELYHNWNNDDQRPWMLSLRAVGYVDILRIPSIAVENSIFPYLKESLKPAALPKLETAGLGGQRQKRHKERTSTIESGLMEFLVEQRLINGKKAMMIDLDRCTRCDDCVRACANAHDNNPRFVRQGPKYDHWMITNACMHCLDPVCMIGCPTGAIGRDGDSGNVLINDQSCIGCSTCANSCPYGNIRMVEINDRLGSPITDQQGTPITKATKCDFCEEQLGGPACQRACPHDALVRIDLTTPDELHEWSRR